MKLVWWSWGDLAATAGGEAEDRCSSVGWESVPQPPTAQKSWEEWKKSTESCWWGGTYGQSVCMCVRRMFQIISDYFCVCMYVHVLVYPSRINLSCLYLFFHRASLERLCQSSLTITERGSRSENGVAAELLSNHEALLQEARSRLRSLQEYQAFEEALKAVETWLKDVERKLEKLENTEGNKKEVEEKLEQAQVHAGKIVGNNNWKNPFCGFFEEIHCFLYKVIKI